MTNALFDPGAPVMSQSMLNLSSTTGARPTASRPGTSTFRAPVSTIRAPPAATKTKGLFDHFHLSTKMLILNSTLNCNVKYVFLDCQLLNAVYNHFRVYFEFSYYLRLQFALIASLILFVFLSSYFDDGVIRVSVSSL